MISALTLLAVTAALRVWLLLRQRRALRGDPAAAYARDVVTQRSGQQLWQSAWALLVLFSAAPILRLQGALGPGFALFALLLTGWLWELPGKAWKPFVIDARHSGNRLSPRRFAREQALSLALFAAAALPAAFIATALFERDSSGWWLPVWALGWFGFATLRWAQPRYVAPLFDTVEPLPDSPLRARLQALLSRCGVARQRLYLLRSSARSAHANAQVSGGLGAPRIVLTDTLIERLPEDQTEAVVAHELGHLQRGHLRFQLLMLGALSLALVALIAALTAGIEGAAPRLALAWALLPTTWLFALPFANAVYRRFEFEADETAANSSSAAAMAGALRTLTQHNANAPRPDRWYERVYHTHPDLGARLARLDRCVHEATHKNGI